MASLPPPPVPSWTLSSTLREDEHFRGKARRAFEREKRGAEDLDDAASPLTLAFPVPFYGQIVQEVQMSSNGLVAMAPDHSTFRPGAKAFGARSWSWKHGRARRRLLRALALRGSSERTCGRLLG